MWQQWVNAVLGLWTIAVPFLSLSGATLMWTLVVTGIAVAVLAVWGASQEQSERTARFQT
ncbi:MAG TPA: SPW repeat protein [Candidatus Paceibacterota bacterium]